MAAEPYVPRSWISTHLTRRETERRRRERERANTERKAATSHDQADKTKARPATAVSTPCAG
ncbi:hypothetical protein [Spongiactinospora sp. TRM90649]|uniref:hypothetical protein n=1 Tax=Spongiactinospora sp. TRM90649 TaxID=3031114 RepID=UPI0023F98B9F|nr:hypothetical protein [Spongiactinospora sp. TRM90649]MDF5756332.1 hypothetical protein [Spongiactinospora sp. TRM90649]